MMNGKKITVKAKVRCVEGEKEGCDTGTSQQEMKRAWEEN